MTRSPDNWLKPRWLQGMVWPTLLLWLYAGALLLLCGCSHPTPRADIIHASISHRTRLGTNYYVELGAQPVVNPQIIREDFAKVKIGTPREKVHHVVGKPWGSLRQSRPTSFPGNWDDPPNTNLTYVLTERYYPPPPLKRLIDSPYMSDGFAVYYGADDRVVHKSLHPDYLSR